MTILDYIGFVSIAIGLVATAFQFWFHDFDPGFLFEEEGR